MLPGLMMLESAVRTASALWRARRHDGDCFASDLDRLERIHIVRRVVPGETLVVRIEIQKQDDKESAKFKARSSVCGELTMRADFRLRSWSHIQHTEGQTNDDDA